MDVSDEAHSCAGHEDEFNRKHAASGWAIFFAIIIPIGIAAAVGTWVWRNWTGKFGQIRLGEQGMFSSLSPSPSSSDSSHPSSLILLRVIH